MSDYEFKDGKIVFPDGVSYSLSETLFIAKYDLSEADIQAIHLVKRKFEGTITGGVFDKDEYTVGPDIEYSADDERAADFLDNMSKKYSE